MRQLDAQSATRREVERWEKAQLTESCPHCKAAASREELTVYRDGEEFCQVVLRCRRGKAGGPRCQPSVFTQLVAGEGAAAQVLAEARERHVPAEKCRFKKQTFSNGAVAAVYRAADVIPLKGVQQPWAGPALEVAWVDEFTLGGLGGRVVVGVDFAAPGCSDSTVVVSWGRPADYAANGRMMTGDRDSLPIPVYRKPRLVPPAVLAEFRVGSLEDALAAVPSPTTFSKREENGSMSKVKSGRIGAVEAAEIVLLFQRKGKDVPYLMRKFRRTSWAIQKVLAAGEIENIGNGLPPQGPRTPSGPLPLSVLPVEVRQVREELLEEMARNRREVIECLVRTENMLMARIGAAETQIDALEGGVQWSGDSAARLRLLKDLFLELLDIEGYEGARDAEGFAWRWAERERAQRVEVRCICTLPAASQGVA